MASVTYYKFPMKMDRFFPPNSWEQITIWWMTYPLKNMSSSDWIIIPTIGENNPFMFQTTNQKHIFPTIDSSKFLMKIESILPITQFKWGHGNIDHVLIAHVCTPIAPATGPFPRSPLTHPLSQRRTLDWMPPDTALRATKAAPSMAKPSQQGKTWTKSGSSKYMAVKYRVICTYTYIYIYIYSV